STCTLSAGSPCPTRRSSDLPTAISHQIRELESSLGMPMFQRHTRRVSLTPAGQQLFPVLKQGFDSFAQAVTDLYPQSRRSAVTRSEEHTSELQSRENLVCRL